MRARTRSSSATRAFGPKGERSEQTTDEPTGGRAVVANAKGSGRRPAVLPQETAELGGAVGARQVGGKGGRRLAADSGPAERGTVLSAVRAGTLPGVGGNGGHLRAVRPVESPQGNGPGSLTRPPPSASAFGPGQRGAGVRAGVPGSAALSWRRRARRPRTIIRSEAFGEA